MPYAPVTRRLLSQTLLAGLLALSAPLAMSADAPAFPQRPINLVVPFAAGGSLDVTARILADKLKDELGQPVVVVNRPGAGSAVGAKFVAGAPPDGYTLFFTSGSAYGFQHLLIPNLDLKLEDLTPVAAVAANPSVIVASTKLPVKTLSELVTYAQQKPDSISFCSTGVGGLNHLQLEMFKRAVKSKTGKDFSVTHVPYNGLAPALTGIRDGSVQACTLPYTSLVKNMNGKELRILAVQRESRLPWIPDVPTTGQQGYPELDHNDAFVTVLAPKGTPQPIISKLQASFESALQDAAVREKLKKLEVQVVFMDSGAAQNALRNDVRRLSAVIQEAGLAKN